MIICPKCNKENEDGVNVCVECGEAIHETVYCPNCGAQTSTEFAFCQSCGCSIESGEMPVEEVAQESEVKKFAIKITDLIQTKKGKMGAAAVAAVLVLVMLLSIIIGSGSTKSSFIYLKDGELTYAKVSKEPWEITDELGDLEGYRALYRTQFSADGEKVFYFEEYDGEEYKGDLYYRSLKSERKDKVKIASDVASYQITEDGKYVFFKEDGDLYRSNLKKKEKVAKDVREFWCSADGKKIVFLNTDGKAYTQTVGKDKDKFDSDVTDLTYVSDDCKTILYKVEDKLYIKEGKKDKEKIASDVSRVGTVFESGNFYFYKATDKEMKLMDFVEDDMASEDKAMKQPTRPYSSDFDSYSDYWDAYDEYYDALDEWYDKEDRDELREELEDAVLETELYDLYYYNGKKAEKVDSNVSTGTASTLEKDLLTYNVCDPSKIDKVLMSEIDSAYDVQDEVETMLDSTGNVHVAVGKKASKLTSGEVGDIAVSADGKTIFYTTDISSESQEADLYKVSVSGSKLGKAKKYDKDVYANNIMVTEEGDCVYYKDIDKESTYTGDLYVNKKKLDKDVRLGRVQYNAERKSYVYITDSNKLMECKGKSVKKIDKDVYSQFYILQNGEVAYFTDYDSENSVADLYVYKNKKSERIDKEVLPVLLVYRKEK